MGDRLDGHSITHLGPEGLKFSLDPLPVFLLDSLILQPLLEAIHGHESHCGFLGLNFDCVLRDDQAMLHPILVVGKVHDANPIGRV
jgi:hypothetical protein